MVHLRCDSFYHEKLRTHVDASPRLAKFQSFILGLAILLPFAASTTAVALDGPSGVVTVEGTEIRINGQIDQAVADSFLRQVQTPGLGRVSLNSPGGSVFPALNIARAIRVNNLNTTVPFGDQCHSACSFLFLAGRERIADGLLGVHQISGVQDPSLTQSAIANIHEELVRFNTPSYLVGRMLRTPPDSMYIFTPEELERHAINIRDASKAEAVPHLQTLESWTRQDWVVGVFMNTHINKPFIALESREMSPLMRIVHYPHRRHTFIEFMVPNGELSGTKSRIELRFGHGNDEPFSLFVDADIESNAYAFDMSLDQDQANTFWAAFSTGSGLTVLNGYGIEIGRFSLRGSRLAFQDFSAIANR